ncbi:MAG: ribbon-helix-helix protein, CopG family [Bacteroidetes bacterium]|jgi:hypothetical protein|nr:ribbon-helix-helix protein, CopG family [Bacteroidota bacterium]
MSTSEDANQNKKDYKVRTSITIDPEVLDAVRKVCIDEARSVSSFIEEALKKKLSPL